MPMAANMPPPCSAWIGMICSVGSERIETRSAAADLEKWRALFLLRFQRLERPCMFRRPMLFAGVLLAAAVVPYVLLDDNLANSAKSQWSRLSGGEGDGKKTDVLVQAAEVAEKAKAAIAKVSTPPPVAIEEVFRFDV